MKKVFFNNDGSALIGFLVGFFVFISVVAFAFSILPVFSVKSQLDAAAEKLIRSAEIGGTTDLSAQIDSLKEEIGTDFSVSWDGTEYFRGNTVQLGGDIKLQIASTYELKFLEYGRYDIPIRIFRQGTSERYFK